MKRIYGLCCVLMSVACQNHNKQATYHITFIKSYKADTFKTDKEIKAGNDSIAYSEGYSSFLFEKSWSAKRDSNTAVIDWKIFDSTGRDVKALLTSSTIHNIENKSEYMRTRLDEIFSKADDSSNSTYKGSTSFLSEVKQNIAVQRAIVSDVGMLCIAVVNDGVSKVAMARYYCRLAQERGASEIKGVKILDAADAIFEPGAAYGTELGKSFCN
jgi:hypothetical protein